MGNAIKKTNTALNEPTRFQNTSPPPAPYQPQEEGTLSNSPDPQVRTSRPYKPRRKLTQAYKIRMVAAYDTCPAAERGALLRREGLYYASISTWRREMEGKGKKPKNKGSLTHLVRENEQLKKQLAQAEAVIDLQKKVSELLGKHILSPERNETN